MKRLTLKVTSGVMAFVMATGLLFVPQNASGIAALVGTGVSVLISTLGKVAIEKTGDWVKGGTELAKLIALVENTSAQLRAMKEEYGKNSEQYQEWKDRLDKLERFRRGAQKTKQVYYAAANVSNFYKGIGDYWNYCKNYGFSNASTSINTVSRGVRLAQQVTRDAIAIVNIYESKDEDGNDIKYDAETATSRVRVLLERINAANEEWAKMIKKDPAVTGGGVADKGSSESLTGTEGFNSLTNKNNY